MRLGKSVPWKGAAVEKCKIGMACGLEAEMDGTDEKKRDI